MNHRILWRRVAEVIVALTLAVPAFSATAQQGPDYGDQAEQPPSGDSTGDVPGRVARLNYFDGTVTFEPAGGNEWAYAELNRPMTTGDQVWVDNGGRSELHIGSTALRLGQQSALSIVNLDDQNAQLKLAQGTLQTRLRDLPAGQSFEIDTPNVALQADGPGSYRVDAAPDGTSTTVTVREGSLSAYGDSGSVQIGPGQQITFSGTNLQETDGGTAQPPDALEAWAVSRDRAEDVSVSARYVSRDVPGYQDLDANGTWEESPDYGQVWVPRVAAGWAPYREGHWAWVAPWGWTWVDDAPWGFAPFHYGRWAYYRNNWAWVPGPVIVNAPPCYSPALVAFVGGGGHGQSWGVSLTVGAAAAGVAWLPLGPGEPWRPAYRYSPRYYDRVNYVNHRAIANNDHNIYINRGAPRAITGMPANQFVRGQGAGRYGQTLRPQQIAHNPIGAGAPAIAPVQQSFGGGLRRANFHPPQMAGARPVIATRNAPTPFAYRDSLARNFAQSGGRVQGAGQPVVRTAPPANFARIANAPGQPGHGASQSAFRVVPAERRPLPAQGQANRGAPGGTPFTGETREGQQRQGQRQGQMQPQAAQPPGDLRPGQTQFQTGQHLGQPGADQRQGQAQMQGGPRPAQSQVPGGERPGQFQANQINGARPSMQAGHPGEVPEQGQVSRENGVPHPPDRMQGGRTGEQPGNVSQGPQRGQSQGEQLQAQQRLVQERAQQVGQQPLQQQTQQQMEQQRAQQDVRQRFQQQPQQQMEQQRAGQAAQQRSQQQAQQQMQQQSAQQDAQQRSQQQAQQRMEQQRAQQDARQRSQQQAQQQMQQQRAQQDAQQRSQQQAQQQMEQQRAQLAAQQRSHQQAQQQMEQQRAQQAAQRQQAAAQQREQQAQNQQRQQQMQNQQRQQMEQQRQQQQQQQQQRAAPPHPGGSAREPRRDEQNHG